MGWDGKVVTGWVWVWVWVWRFERIWAGMEDGVWAYGQCCRHGKGVFVLVDMSLRERVLPHRLVNRASWKEWN